MTTEFRLLILLIASRAPKVKRLSRLLARTDTRQRQLSGPLSNAAVVGNFAEHQSTKDPHRRGSARAARWYTAGWFRNQAGQIAEADCVYGVKAVLDVYGKYCSQRRKDQWNTYNGHKCPYVYDREYCQSASLPFMMSFDCKISYGTRLHSSWETRKPSGCVRQVQQREQQSAKIRKVKMSNKSGW